MTILEELKALYVSFEREDISVDEALEIQLQIDFLEEIYSRELEDYDCV